MVNPIKLFNQFVRRCLKAMAMLEVYKGGREVMPESFAILKTKTIIGRDSKCDVTLGWDGMSRVHAEIEGMGRRAEFSTAAGGRMHTAFCVRDRGSSNGVFVNNIKVSESLLRDGDTLAFGRGRAVRVGEVAPERYFEYIFVFRTLKLHGQQGQGFLPSQRQGGKNSADEKVKGQIHPPCKSHLYPPSTWPEDEDGNSVPNHVQANADLVLEWVHGYRCATAVVEDFGMPVAGQCDNLSNVHFLNGNRIAYPAASFVIVYDLSSHTQKFFTSHDADCISLTVDSTRELACSGQVSTMSQRNPPIYVWATNNLQVLAKLQGFHKRKVAKYH